MSAAQETLAEIRDLYQQVVGAPAPEIDARSLLPFPPGVDPLQHAMQEVEYLKKLAEQTTIAPRPCAWIPTADAFTTEDRFVVRLDVPGVTREDVKVFLAGNECVIRGDRKPLAATPDLRPVAMERCWGPFERRFPLPPGSCGDSLKARCADGVLEIEVPLQSGPVHLEREITLD